MLYKSKLKPWYKERRDGPESTPMVTGDIQGELVLSRDLECIPLQTIHSEQCEEGDEELYYLDTQGDYIFPSLPPAPSTCSCPHG